MTISKLSFSCHCALMLLSIPNKQPPRTRTIKRLGILLQVLLDLLKFLFQVVIITCESQVLHDFHGHARSPLLPLLVRQGGSLLLRLDPLPRQRAPYLSGLHHDLQEVVHIVFLLLLLYEWQRSSKRIPSVIVERMICSGDMYAIKDTLCCSMNKGYIKGLKRIRFCCLLFALLCRLACQFVILPIRNLALTWTIASNHWLEGHIQSGLASRTKLKFDVRLNLRSHSRHELTYLLAVVADDFGSLHNLMNWSNLLFLLLAALSRYARHDSQSQYTQSIEVFPHDTVEAFGHTSHSFLLPYVLCYGWDCLERSIQ